MLKLSVSLIIDETRLWDTHKKLYLAGCEKERIEPNKRVMSEVTEAEGGGKLKEQRTLDDWTVAKVPQWSKAGLMEHIVELVVVDDQVSTVTSFM
jgi:hypothetical protein